MKKEVLNNSFVFYATNLEVIETLEETDKELANDFMKAIIEYGIYGEYESTNPIIKVLMVQAGFGIDKAKDRYATAVENGKKGGRPRKEIDIEKALELESQGKTQAEIAEELGVSKNTIGSRLREHKNQKPNPKTKNLNDNVNDNENENDNVKVNGNSTAINWNFTAPVRKNELKTEEAISKCAEGTISECGAQFQNVSGAQSENVYNIKEINNNNKKEIDKGDFVASQQNPATPLATQVGSVKQVEVVAADKVITINCSDMRDSYYHLYKYLAKYQPALASFVVNGVAFSRNNKERTDKAIEICNTYGFTINFNDTAAAVAGV